MASVDGGGGIYRRLCSGWRDSVLDFVKSIVVASTTVEPVVGSHCLAIEGQMTKSAGLRPVVICGDAKQRAGDCRCSASTELNQPIESSFAGRVYIFGDLKSGGKDPIVGSCRKRGIVEDTRDAFTRQSSDLHHLLGKIRGIEAGPVTRNVGERRGSVDARDREEFVDASECLSVGKFSLPPWLEKENVEEDEETCASKGEWTQGKVYSFFQPAFWRKEGDLPFDGAPDMHIMQNKKGLGIQIYRWVPSQGGVVKGALVLLHGIRSHMRLTWLAKPSTKLPKSNPVPIQLLSAEGRDGSVDHARYSDIDRDTQLFYEGSWVQALVHSGYVVYGMDLQGHGRSEAARGRPCYVEDFDDYTEDLAQVLEEIVNPELQGAPVFVVGVSISTLIVSRLLEDERSPRFNIRGACLISGLLGQGGKYNSAVYNALLNFLVYARKIIPTRSLPFQKSGPEVSLPEWQLEYGRSDKYFVPAPFTVNLLGTTVEGLRKCRQHFVDLIRNNGCKEVYIIHNYEDSVNPVDGVLSGLSLMTRIKSTFNEIARTPSKVEFRATIFNAPTDTQWISDPVERERLSFLECDARKFDLNHTLVTDADSIHVFQKFYNWLESLCS